MAISSMGKVGRCFSVVVLIICCIRIFYCSAMASGLFRARRSDLILNLNAINVLCHVSHLQHTAVHGRVCAPFACKCVRIVLGSLLPSQLWLLALPCLPCRRCRGDET